MEEKIRQKIEKLAEQKAQLIAQLNAIMGAERVLSDLLKEEESHEDIN